MSSNNLGIPGAPQPWWRLKNTEVQHSWVTIQVMSADWPRDTQGSTQWTYCETITWHFSSHTARRDNSVKACVEHRAAASVLFRPTASASGSAASPTLSHPGSYITNPSLKKKVQSCNQSDGPPARWEEISIFSGLTSAFGTWRVGLKKGSEPVTPPGADGSTQFCFLLKRSAAT